MTRVIRLTGRTAADPVEITFIRPTCAACGLSPTGVGFVRTDAMDGTEAERWLCDNCLTPEQRATWCRDLWRESK